jgi:hypothetical protein
MESGDQSNVVSGVVLNHDKFSALVFFGKKGISNSLIRDRESGPSCSEFKYGKGKRAF